MTRTFSVEVSDSTAESLEKYEEERIISELQETLSTLAEESSRRQSELRREVMNLPEEPPPEEDELSEEELNEEIRRFIRGKRDTDPRLE